MRHIASALVLIACATVPRPSAAQTSGTTCLEGFVRFYDGSPVGRAVVVLFSPCLSGGRYVLTDERGAFQITEAPACSTNSLQVRFCPGDTLHYGVGFPAYAGARHLIEVFLPPNTTPLPFEGTLGWTPRGPSPSPCSAPDLGTHFHSNEHLVFTSGQTSQPAEARLTPACSGLAALAADARR